MPDTIHEIVGQVVQFGLRLCSGLGVRPRPGILPDHKPKKMLILCDLLLFFECVEELLGDLGHAVAIGTW